MPNDSLAGRAGGTAGMLAAERQRIAEAIHDGPIQHLHAARLALSAAGGQGADPELVREAARRALACLDDAARELREVTR
jgi:signal transduction histidine kinase